MKVLIISDTHGSTSAFDIVVEREKDIDMLIHLGDVERDEEYIEFMAKCPTVILAGNNDLFSRLPSERQVKIGKYEVFMTHGHPYYVSRDTVTLRRIAQERGANIVMFGHTHKPYFDIEGDVKVINPGSLSYPRQEGRQGTYIIMHLEPLGGVKFELKYV